MTTPNGEDGGRRNRTMGSVSEVERAHNESLASDPGVQVTGEIKSFDDMNLKPLLLRGIYEYGFKKPSDFQQRAIIHALQGRNVISETSELLEATSAILIPLLQRVDLALNECQALVLVSSRELARNLVLVIRSYLDGSVQIGDTAPPSVNCYAVVGGSIIQEEAAMLRKEGCQVLVSTPGRALDFIRRRVISMNSLKMICLRDIGDMLNRQFGSFIEDVIKFPDLPGTIQVIATSYGTFDEREFLEQLVGDLICVRRVQTELWDGCC